MAGGEARSTGHRSNGFDWLRLLAAAAVIYGHSFPLTGHVAPGVLSNGVQTIGVKVFFGISGFLITKSWQADPNPLRFATKRFLRVMPGLAAICLVSVFVLGPVFTSLSLRAYLSQTGTYQYFWNIALYPIYGLPGVFDGNAFGPAVNGSLWSLPVWGSSVISVLETAVYFCAGAAMATWQLERAGSVTASLFMLGIAAISVNNNVAGEVVLALLLSYAVISVGSRHFSWGQRLIAGRDYSYGLYLYGFPVQQAVVHILGPMSALKNALIAFPVALLCAVLSWHLLEARALASKPSKFVDPQRRPRAIPADTAVCVSPQR